MKFTFLLLFAIISMHCGAQLAYPYKVYSENKNYFVKSIPFSDQVRTALGKTVIYNSNDTLTPLATIGKYFTPDYLLLSNDGKALMFLDNWIDRSVDNNPDVLTYFYMGKLVRAYKLSDLHLADSVSILTVLYNSHSGMDGAIKYPSINRDSNVYLKGDTLYLFVHNEFVNKFLMANGKLVEREPFADYLKRHSDWKNDRLVERLNIKIPTQYGLPRLATGKQVWTELQDKLGVIFLEGENMDLERKYKHYPFEIICAIDSTGSCTEIHIEMAEPLYRTEIVDFLRSVKYDKKVIPAGIEKWYFQYGTGFRKKSKRLAARERREQIDIEKLEYEKRILQDSIDNIYIPADVEDCFTALDQMLDKRDKSEFRNMSEDEAGGHYHMGLGLWMRNNWALWRGSRLSHYFNKLGIKHPDDMSGIVLRSYHRNLNGRNIQLEEQIRVYKK